MHLHHSSLTHWCHQIIQIFKFGVETFPHCKKSKWCLPNLYFRTQLIPWAPTGRDFKLMFPVDWWDFAENWRLIKLMLQPCVFFSWLCVKLRTLVDFPDTKWILDWGTKQEPVLNPILGAWRAPHGPMLCLSQKPELQASCTVRTRWTFPWLNWGMETLWLC